MAKRRHRRKGGYTPPSETRFYAPQRPATPFSLIGPLPPYRGGFPARRSAPPALDHPATARTVRPLIRTVLTDTRPRSGTRTHLDVSRRALTRTRTRLNPWSPVAFGDTPTVYPRAFICARRAIRREVLFAIKATGRGAGAPRRFTANSKVRC